MTLNFLQSPFIAEELMVPQFVAPVVILTFVVLAILLVLVFGRSPSAGDSRTWPAISGGASRARGESSSGIGGSNKAAGEVVPPSNPLTGPLPLYGGPTSLGEDLP